MTPLELDKELTFLLHDLLQNTGFKKSEKAIYPERRTNVSKCSLSILRESVAYQEIYTR